MAVGVTAVIEGSVFLTASSSPPFWMRMAGVLALLSGISLVIGFLTPIAAGLLIALAALGTAFSWVPPSTSQLVFDSALPAIFVIVVTTAVVFLGPGSLSLDARLFGRREIIIPRIPRSSPPRVG